MAANTNLFTDKETNNWFKASIALIVTKQGLTNFLDTELKNVHAVVGRSCGNCPIEKLIPCPTNPYCNKKKRNYCNFHKSQKPQPCPTCDNVKQNIILQHRYGGPSWRNTKAENWALDYWEVGKCFLPPDGYCSVSSVQETDFNGLISIMLNCLHFQTCLSSSCLAPPPPDNNCPLEKVRQIGRDVRHTSNCKVTDADLHNYFQTLATLLADPNCLQHDPSATTACARLRDLQKDRMSIKELGELLNEAYLTLKHAKEAGERFSEEAERTLEKVLENKTHIGEEHIKSKTQLGEERIEGKTKHGELRIEHKTHDAEQSIDSKTQHGEERIESMTQLGEQFIVSRTYDAEHCIKSKTQHGEKRIECKTQQGEQCIENKTHDAEICLDSKIQDGTQLIENNVHDAIMRLKQATNETAQLDYERGKEDFCRRLVEYYSEHSSNVPLSILDQSLDKRIADIYETPKMHRIEIKKDGMRVKKEQVMAYKDVFYTKDISNRRIYVQGEPGSGKSTFAAKLVHDWSQDLLNIRKFKFIFFISLRDSRGQTDVMHMIKKQLIDAMFSEQNRDDVYKLVHKIIQTEKCLVVRDALDEWVAPDGSNLAEPSMAGFPNDNCTILTTSRPWKLADDRIKNSQIAILLEIEGINDPHRFSERILRCILDESRDLMNSAWEIRNFMWVRRLTSLSHSPMLYTLVICTWVEMIEEEERFKGSSLCALYTTLLESLCKKANDTIGFFNDINPPQVRCFLSTSYLRPIIQNVNVISKAAFHLLFSPEKESSIVFNDRKISNYVSEFEKDFALKAGLISRRKTGKALNASISFIHKSMQEFLAAYHIARNAHLIDDVISGYLTRHKDAYLDISQVFIFLCGLNISSANKLSGMMNEQNAKMMDKSADPFRSLKCSFFQNSIDAGYREAVLNEQTGILLRLSHLKFHMDNLMDVYNIWLYNAPNALELNVDLHEYHDKHTSPAHSAPISHVEFDLSSCLKLKSLKLWGSRICIQEFGCSVSSALPIRIVLNIADPVQCVGPHPVLPCIEDIFLASVRLSSSFLRNLFSILRTLDHTVQCLLFKCNITSCVEDAVRGSDTKTYATLKYFKNTSNMLDIENESPGLWEGLHGLNIKSLSLSVWFEGLNVNHADSMSQSLSSLTHLETLSIKIYKDTPGMLEALNGLNIKSLSLIGRFGGLVVNHAVSMLQALSSLKHLEKLGIGVDDDSPGMWEALHDLNVKSLSLIGGFRGLNINHAVLMSQSLASLTHLETLSIELNNDTPGMWEALHGLDIKSLSLSRRFGGWNVNYPWSMLQALSSLTHLENLSIEVDDDSPALWEALHDLHVKSLSLSGGFRGLIVFDGESMLKSLSSLTHLETLSMELKYDSIALWEALHALHVKSLSLSGRFGGWYVNHPESMLLALSSLRHLEKLFIEVNVYNPDLLRALHGLNIKSLSIKGGALWFKRAL